MNNNEVMLSPPLGAETRENSNTGLKMRHPLRRDAWMPTPTHVDYYPNVKGGYAVIRIEREKEKSVPQQISQKKQTHHVQFPVQEGFDKVNKMNDAVEITSAIYKIIFGGDLIGPQYTIAIRALLLFGKKLLEDKKNFIHL